MTIHSKPATDAYRDGWDRVFGEQEQECRHDWDERWGPYGDYSCVCRNCGLTQEHKPDYSKEEYDD